VVEAIRVLTQPSPRLHQLVVVLVVVLITALVVLVVLVVAAERVTSYLVLVVLELLGRDLQELLETDLTFVQVVVVVLEVLHQPQLTFHPLVVLGFLIT
jgi:hypothetical protein